MKYLVSHTMYGEGETPGGSHSQLILSHTRAFHACDNLKSGWRWSHRRSVALDDPCVNIAQNSLCVFASGASMRGQPLVTQMLHISDVPLWCTQAGAASSPR